MRAATAAGIAVALGGIIRDVVSTLADRGTFGEALAVPATLRAALPIVVLAELEMRFSAVGDFTVLAFDYGPQELIRRKQAGAQRVYPVSRSGLRQARLAQRVHRVLVEHRRGEPRRHRAVAVGGQARLCDPAVNVAAVAAGDSRGC